MKTYKLPCGCVIAYVSENVERILKQCDCCAAEFNERHSDDVARHAAARAELWAAERAKAVPA